MVHRNVPQLGPLYEQFGRSIPNSIPTIVKLIKSVSTKRINISRRTPGIPVWQRNYYENVVRNQPDLERIRKYIRENPAKWNKKK